MNNIAVKKSVNKLEKSSMLIWYIVRFIIVFGLVFIILKPFAVKILMAFMTPDDLLDQTVRLIPKHIDTYYWKVALDGLDLNSTLFRSSFMSLMVSIIQMMSSAFIGYGLGRFKFKGRNFAYIMVVVIMLIPPQTYSIAQYLGYHFFGIGPFTMNTINTLTPLFLNAFGGIGFKQGLYIYLFMIFFKGLPRDLENAAYIDGAGPIKTFFTVIMPNAVTTMVTIILFSFSWQWTDLAYPGLFFPDLKVISTQIAQIYIRVGLTPDPIGSSIAQNAACMLLIIPLLVLFIFGQKFLTQSISRTGQAN